MLDSFMHVENLNGRNFDSNLFDKILFLDPQKKLVRFIESVNNFDELLLLLLLKIAIRKSCKDCFDKNVDNLPNIQRN